MNELDRLKQKKQEQDLIDKSVEKYRVKDEPNKSEDNANCLEVIAAIIVLLVFVLPVACMIKYLLS